MGLKPFELGLEMTGAEIRYWCCEDYSVGEKVQTR